MNFKTRTQSPRRRHALQVRRQVEDGIRAFFTSRGFEEVRTPLLVPSPGMEPHIRPFEVTHRNAARSGAGFLQTSPEFAMKKLLVGGLERIFQMAPCFRDEPHSPHHRPEFLMLEWYRAHASLVEIMNDVEELLEFLALRIRNEPIIRYQGHAISVARPWPRQSVRALFKQELGIDLVHADLRQECEKRGLPISSSEWDDLFFLLWLNFIEPRFPSDRALIVHEYPASQAALATLSRDRDGTEWANRFEFYAGGLELGNAFHELTDPRVQRERFAKDMDLREKIYGAEFPRSPVDESFISALEEGLPPSSGIAVGVDRLVMLLADEPDIDFTLW